ncbi:transporter [Robertkochia marina]|uniref:Transporter n=1 Tax=Robertkochia marina TaxID=1227945 RepID=A0A4S3LZH6_9FLAO|nr:transporter [Robertkochia marina]THD65689.1 transporter [Robertkochia marina]TRZ46627.1 transporter [Robertkochia marina]
MKNTTTLKQAALTFLLFLFTMVPVLAQEEELPQPAPEQTQEQKGGSDADALAKQLQNPVASLISVPFQFNFDFGIGPDDGTRMIMNFQPVVPISISEDWNLIGRVILPVIWQQDCVPCDDDQFGLGDAVVSAFFSPKDPGPSGIIWGVGPVLLVPTATDDLLGQEKFGIGPTAVVLKQFGSLTAGALANHIWSVAGNSDRADVNASFFQPFLAQNFPGGWAVSVNTEIAQDWDNDLTNGTLNLTGSKVTSIGSQLVNIFIGPRFPYGNGNPADWGFRTGIVLLFPK